MIDAVFSDMAAIRESVVPMLEQLLPRPAVRSILATLPSTADAPVGTLDLVATRQLLDNLEAGFRTFGTKLSSGEREQLKARVTGGKVPKASELHVRVESDQDVQAAQRAAQALLRGLFAPTDCVRMTTLIAELAGHIRVQAGRANLRLCVADEGSRVRLEVVATDKGPGLSSLSDLLAGKSAPKTVLEKGLVGFQRLFDDVKVETVSGKGTTLLAVKRSAEPR
jgi:anti-sigma regulatory factor (Ser/Thr protein kinase)